MGALDWMTGTISGEDYNSLPGVSGPNQAAYQNPDVAGYQQHLGGLLNASGAMPDFGMADQTRGMQMQNVGQLQGLANGTGPSPAQVFLQQNQQAAMRNMQAQALTSQAGANPALAFRGLMNAQGALQSQVAGQGAMMQQQAQQQAQLALGQQLAGLHQQDFGQANAVAQNQRQNTYDQQGIIGQQYGMSNQQNQNAMAFDRANVQNQMYQRMQQEARMQAEAQKKQALARGVATAVGTAAGAVGGSFIPGAGTMAGGMLGGQLAGSLFGGGGGGGMDPAMMAMLMQQGGGGGGGGGAPQPFTFDNGMTPQDANLAYNTQSRAGIGLNPTRPY